LLRKKIAVYAQKFSTDWPTYQMIWKVTATAYCSGREVHKTTSTTTLYQLHCAHYRQCIKYICRTWWQH